MVRKSPSLLAPLQRPFATEDCLVDCWVGSGRTLFLDLAAGPFSWGPVIGGEGVRTNHSLPSVDTFGLLMMKEASEHTDPSAAVASEGEDALVDATYDWEAIESEKLLVEDFLDSNCRQVPPHPECASYARKLQQLAAFIAQQQPVNSKLERDFEHANAFSFFAHSGGGHQESLIEAQFMAQLSATLSSTLRLSLTPLSAPPPLPSPYAPRVSFHLFVLRDHDAYNPLDHSFLPRFKASLERLRLPAQDFAYSVQTLTMADDPRLSMAFSTSLRSTVIPTIRAGGGMATRERLYIDSSEIEYELSKIEEKWEREHGGAAVKSTRQIPIFLLSLDDALPVFIDKHYRARALRSMVVAVQSPHQQYESELACGRKPIIQDLRDPLKPLVQATAELLGGLLPAHASYNHAHQRVSEDWLWSVGATACALTSHALGFSQVQADSLHRSYVTSVVRYAKKVLDELHEGLSELPTSGGNEGLGLVARIALEQRKQTLLSAREGEQVGRLRQQSRRRGRCGCGQRSGALAAGGAGGGRDRPDGGASLLQPGVGRYVGPLVLCDGAVGQ